MDENHNNISTSTIAGNTGQPAQAIPNQPISNAGVMTQYPAGEPVQSAPTRKYTAAESCAAVICVILGFIFTHYVCGYSGGIWGGIFWGAFGALGAVFVKINKIPVKPLQTAAFVTAEIFCIVPFISANPFINTLAALYAFMLLFYLGISLSGADIFGSHFASDMAKSVLLRPFTCFADGCRAICGLFKNKKAGKNVLHILLGLIIAVPLTLAVVVLLIFSDQAFEDAIGAAYNALPKPSALLIWELICTVPAAMYLSGGLFACARPLSPTKDTLPSYRFMPMLIAGTAVTPICVFYLIYVVTQFNYFTAAFGGVLPEEYSYSRYARRGFFELCAVAVINLAVIVFIQSFVRRNEKDERPPMLRIYTVMISVFTLLLIASAFSKMILYISEMGMTLLRVYTSWFMAVLAVVFIVIIIWQFKALPFWKIMFAAFSVMLGVLCFGNVDAVIARHNVEAHARGEISLDGSDVRAMYCDLSPAAAPYILSLSPEGNIREWMIDEYAADMRETLLRMDKFAYFSVQRAGAERAINEYLSEKSEQS